MLAQIENNQLLRYGYAGFLIAALIINSFPAEAHKFIEDAGSVVGPLCIFALGGFVYTIFRYIIGDILLFNITHFLHHLLDVLFNNKNASSLTGYLGSVKKVRFGQRRQAYTDITNELFEHEIKQRLKTDHAEINIMYLTSLVGFIVFLFLLYWDKTTIALFRALGLFSPLIWLFAIYMDIKQHKKEFRMLSLKEGQIDEVLVKYGYKRT